MYHIKNGRPSSPGLCLSGMISPSLPPGDSSHLQTCLCRRGRSNSC